METVLGLKHRNIDDNCHVADAIKESWLDVSPGHGQDTSDFWHNSGKLVHEECLYWDYVLGCYKVEELYLELGHGQNTSDAPLSVGVYACVYCKAAEGAVEHDSFRDGQKEHQVQESV